MKYIVTIVLVFTSLRLFAQTNADVKKACEELNKAMLKRDTVAIKKLVDDKIQYGHSNGWIQTRGDMMNDMYNGKLTYTDIQQSDIQMQTEGNTAIVRSSVSLDAAMNSKPLSLKMKVLQVWIKKKNGWVLFARQSVKI